MTSRRLLTKTVLLAALAITIVATVAIAHAATLAYCTAAKVVLTRAEKLLNVTKYIVTEFNITNTYIEKLITTGQELINKSLSYLETGNCSLALQYAIKATIVLNKAYAAAIAKSYIAQHRIVQNIVSNYTIFMWRWTERIYAQTMNRTRLMNRTEVRHQLREIVRNCITECRNVTGLRRVRCMLTCVENNITKTFRINATIVRRILVRRFAHILERRLAMYLTHVSTINITVIRKPEIINGTCRPGLVKVCIERPLLNKTTCRLVIIPCNKTEIEKIEQKMMTLYREMQRELLRIRYMIMKLRLLRMIYRHMNMTLNMTVTTNITAIRVINLTKYIERLEKALHILRHKFEERLHNIEKVIEMIRRHHEHVRIMNVTGPEEHHKVSIEHETAPVCTVGNVTCAINMITSMYGECINSVKYMNYRGAYCIVIVPKNVTCERILRMKVHEIMPGVRICILRPGTVMNETETLPMPGMETSRGEAHR